MTTHVGVVRNAKGLRTALRQLKSLDAASRGDTVLSNMILTARLITASALQRKESRGGHFRSDFPRTNIAFQHRTFITIDDLHRIEAPRRATAGSMAVAGCPS